MYIGNNKLYLQSPNSLHWLMIWCSTALIRVVVPSSENRFGNAFRGLLFLLQLAIALFIDNSFYYYSRSMYFLCISHYPLVYVQSRDVLLLRGCCGAYSAPHHYQSAFPRRDRENSRLCLIFLPCWWCCAQNALLSGVLFLWWYPSPGMCRRCNMLNIHSITLPLFVSLPKREKSSTPDFSPFIYIHNSNNNNNNTIDPVLVAFFSLCSSSPLHQFNFELPLWLARQLSPFPIALITCRTFGIREGGWRRTTPTL